MMQFLTEILWMAVMFLYMILVPAWVLKGLYEWYMRQSFVNAFHIAGLPKGIRPRMTRPGESRKNGYLVQETEYGYACEMHVNGWRAVTDNPDEMYEAVQVMGLQGHNLAPMEGSVDKAVWRPVIKKSWDTPVMRPFRKAFFALAIGCILYFALYAFYAMLGSGSSDLAVIVKH